MQTVDEQIEPCDPLWYRGLLWLTLIVTIVMFVSNVGEVPRAFRIYSNASLFHAIEDITVRSIVWGASATFLLRKIAALPMRDNSKRVQGIFGIAALLWIGVILVGTAVAIVAAIYQWVASAI